MLGIFQENKTDVRAFVLPGGQNIGFATTEMDGAYAADAQNPTPEFGLGNGEHVDVIFDLMNGGTVSDVIAQMISLDILVGAHIQAISENDFSVSAATIPAPGALSMGAPGLGLDGWVRHRFEPESAENSSEG